MSSTTKFQLRERIVTVAERVPERPDPVGRDGRGRKFPGSHRSAMPPPTELYFGYTAGSSVPDGSEIPVVPITGVQFGLFSPEEIVRMSAMQITETRLLSDLRLGASRTMCCTTCSLDYQGCPGHMGHITLPVPVINPLLVTHTLRIVNVCCFFCARIIVQPNILGLLYPLPRFGGPAAVNKRIRDIVAYCQRQSQCFHCGRARTVTRPSATPGPTPAITSMPGHRDVPVSSIALYHLLSRIPDTDLRALGLKPDNHPAHSILWHLPVLPHVGRPTSQNAAGVHTQDDITNEYAAIIQAIRSYNVDGNNQRLVDIAVAIEHIFADQNPSPTARGPAKTKYNSVRTRWGGKLGRLRRELMGKRVNFCARTVVTCDAFLAIDSIGIPYEVLQRMTKPMIVQEFNQSYAQHLVETGQVQFVQTPRTGGMRHVSFLTEQRLTLRAGDVLLRDGRKYPLTGAPPVAPHWLRVLPVTLTNVDNTFRVRMCAGDRLLRNGQWMDPMKTIVWPRLNIGDHLLVTPQAGDPVLFNRQPTLVEESMVRMRIVPMPVQSFACNCAAVEALRGDYDGDEINVHFPQSPQTESELQHIMSLERLIVTGQGSKPVVRLINDALVFAFMVTRYDDRMGPWSLPRATWQQMVASLHLDLGDTVLRMRALERAYHRLTAESPDAHVVCSMPFEQYRYTGMALISMLLPESMFFEGPEPNDVFRQYLAHNRVPRRQWRVRIAHGLMYSGILESDVLNGRGGIIHHLYINHSAAVAAAFISNMQIATAHASMAIYSLSISLNDCRLPAELLEACQRGISEAIDRISTTTLVEEDTHIHLQAASMTPIENLVNIQRTNEHGLIRHLCRNRGGHTPNHMLLLPAIGSKGSVSNLLQTTLCLGQQVIQGAQVPLEYDGRVFPHVHVQGLTHRESLRARGLIHSRNFFMGLSPLDFFVHAMAARDALVEGAVAPAQSGYAMRLLMKMLEHNSTHYDLTVRDQHNNIVQFMYAGDGFDRRYTKNDLPVDVRTIIRMVVANAD